jgi:hypothetical protein
MSKRWEPGHYLQATSGVLRNGYDANKAALIQNNANFKGIQVSVWWGQTEITQGDYTQLYAQLDVTRAWAQTYNKKIWLRLCERSFHDEDRPAPFPQYIRDTGEWYNLTMASAAGYTGNERIYTPKIWKPGFVRERFLLWCEKVAEYVATNPEFVLISNEEYSMAAAWLLPDFSVAEFDSLWREFATRMLAKMGAALLHCNTGWSAIGGQSVSYYKNTLDQLVGTGIQALGPTDLRKDNEQGSAFLATEFGQFMTNLPTANPPGYRGNMAFCAKYEWPDYASIESPAEHLRWGVDELGLHFIAWDPDRGNGAGASRNWFWSDALTAVNAANGRINTTAPAVIAVWSWDGKKIPDAMLTRAVNAANEASNGNKNAAYLSSLQTDLGVNPKRYLYRDAVEVWEGAINGQVQIQNGQLLFPATSSTVRIVDADIDTGTWLHRVVSATNSANQLVSRVTKTGGTGPLFLTNDLVAAAGTLNLSNITYGGLSFDTAVTTPVSITLGTPTFTTTTATLSMTVAGTIPAGAQMQIQITTNQDTGPWTVSAQPAAAVGVFTHTFTGLNSGTLYYWRGFVYTDPGGIVHAQTSNATFTTLPGTTAPPASTEWLQLLNNAMTVQDVTERFTSGNDFGRIIGSDGSPVPFPDSYAGYVSFAGIQASLSGRSTGIGQEVTSWNGRALSTPPPATPNILNFSAGLDCAGIWSWWSTKTGHNAPNSRLRVSDMFLALYLESTRQWQLMFSGMRVSGVRYYSLFGQPSYGAGEDMNTDPNATYLTLPNGYNIEAWAYPTASNPSGHPSFFGAINRTAYADSRSWCIGVKVRVEGSDRANARFIGNIGLDHHRSDYYGDASRYWPSGYPAFVSDSGGGEWRNIRNDGQDQWIVAIGCFELARFKANRPPWGNWDGTWPFSAAPDYGPSWQEVLNNPPPDYRFL